MSDSPFGPRSTLWLAEVGIVTIEDLRGIGAVAAYRRVKTAYPREVTMNMLWALHAAIEGMPWHAVDAATKERLRRELTNTPR